MNSALMPEDLRWCLRRAPKSLLQEMKKLGKSVMVAGGFIRSCVAHEAINDIDCFTTSKEAAESFALKISPDGRKSIHESENSFTVKMRNAPAVQVIHRWTFDSPEACVNSFDFTIARAAFWFESKGVEVNSATREEVSVGAWKSTVDPRFYADLAAKRLIYCSPLRIEEAGGSLLRVLKFYQRGYRIPVDSLGAVVSRLVLGMRPDDLLTTHDVRAGRWSIHAEEKIARVATGLLREVDPNVDPTHVAHLPAEDSKEPEQGEADQLVSSTPTPSPAPDAQKSSEDDTGIDPTPYL